MTNLQKYESEVHPLTESAEALTIRTAEDMTQATELLSMANLSMDKIEAEENKIVLPAKEVIKAEQARWKPLKDSLKPAIALLRTKISAYQTEELRKTKEKEAKLAERAAKGTLKFETAVKKSAALSRPEEKVSTALGSLSFRPTQQLVIEDLNSIPREYLVPDEQAILTALKSGKKVPGARVETIQVPINRR